MAATYTIIPGQLLTLDPRASGDLSVYTLDFSGWLGTDVLAGARFITPDLCEPGLRLSAPRLRLTDTTALLWLYGGMPGRVERFEIVARSSAHQLLRVAAQVPVLVSPGAQDERPADAFVIDNTAIFGTNGLPLVLE